MENLKRFWMFGNDINKIPFEIKNLKQTVNHLTSIIERIGQSLGVN